MDTPRELILQDVRCFKGTQRGRLRPVTLLVGENSTGKTTFLGCYRVLHQVLSRREVDARPLLDDGGNIDHAWSSETDGIRKATDPGSADLVELGPAAVVPPARSPGRRPRSPGPAAAALPPRTLGGQ